MEDSFKIPVTPASKFEVTHARRPSKYAQHANSPRLSRSLFSDGDSPTTPMDPVEEAVSKLQPKLLAVCQALKEHGFLGDFVCFFQLVFQVKH